MNPLDIDTEVPTAPDGAGPATFSGIPVSQPVHKQTERGLLKDWHFHVQALMFVVPTVWMCLTDNLDLIGTLACIQMMGLIFLKLPIAIALTVPGVMGMWCMRGQLAAESALTKLPYETVAAWTLSVVPMFVFMGLLLWRSGITTSLYNVGRRSLSWLPGGLAVGTNFAGAGFAAVSGSSVATTHALTRVGVPEMLKAGYHPRLAMGAVVVAGLAGQILPPSIMLIIYSGIASTPVGPQLLAGVGPGLFIPLLFTVAIILVAKFWPGMVDESRAIDTDLVQEDKTSLWTSLRQIWPVPVLIFVVIGTMYTGIFTATEAGACAALFALFLTMWWKRNGGLRESVVAAARGTISSTGGIFFLLLGGTIFARMLSLTGLPRNLASWVESVGFNRIGFLLFLVVLYLLLGTFMDPLPMMLLTVPVLIPALEAVDVSLLWFGVFIVFMGELAVLSPPVGVLLYIMHGIVQDKEVNLGIKIPFKDALMGVLIFLPAAILMAFIMIIWPELVTWIPDNFKG